MRRRGTTLLIAANKVPGVRAVATPGQLDDIARNGAETKGGAVDQSELPFLDRVDRTAAPPLQRFRQEKDRGERRTQVVRHLDHQLQAIRRGEPVGEVLRPVGFEVLAVDRGTWPVEFMFTLGLIIGGGTAQIQKNIISERGLGMPREPKPAVA